MDQDKHIKEEIENMVEQGFDFDDIIGHKVEFSIEGSKNMDNTWNIEAKAEFSMSVNGMDWASVTVPVQAIDTSYDDALASAMMGVASGLNNPYLLAEIRYQLNQQISSEGGII